jgi:pre-mRNA-splicing helicase BRR2
VLAILKDEHGKDPQRKVQLGKLLMGKPSLNDGVYNKMVKLGREMEDYVEYRDRNLKRSMDMEDGGGGGEEVDDEMGVAVVFDDSEAENEEDSDVEEDVVRLYCYFVLFYV